MNAVVQQGMIQLVYSTFLHNSEALAFFVGIVLALLLLLRKPQRIYVLFLLGFTTLFIRFEYLKHIADPLQQQTVGVVVTEQGYQRTRRLIDIFINDLLPLVMYIGGWGSLFMAMIFSNKKNRKG
jgi:hypothetical protein